VFSPHVGSSPQFAVSRALQKTYLDVLLDRYAQLDLFLEALLDLLGFGLVALLVLVEVLDVLLEDVVALL